MYLVHRVSKESLLPESFLRARQVCILRDFQIRVLGLLPTLRRNTEGANAAPRNPKGDHTGRATLLGTFTPLDEVGGQFVLFRRLFYPYSVILVAARRGAQPKYRFF